jgi:hypothetical protein
MQHSSAMISYICGKYVIFHKKYIFSQKGIFQHILQYAASYPLPL